MMEVQLWVINDGDEREWFTLQHKKTNGKCELGVTNRGGNGRVKGRVATCKGRELWVVACMWF